MTPVHWLSGGSGNDAGFEDLQTDVMRFMAILAFCLMAVFALVQSLPLTPDSPPAAADTAPVVSPMASPVADTVPAVSPTATPVAAEPPPQAAGDVAKTVSAAPLDVEAARPAPAPAPIESVSAEPAAPASPEAALEPAAAQPPSEGVTLRFSSDAALRRLVARGRVGLFAFSEGQSWQLAPSTLEASFRTASAPTEFHAMATGTVPADVVVAMTQQTGAASRTVSWGVTLPLPTRYAIARLVREFDSGALVIGADGRVAREAPQ